jgi:hypothetical protein
MSTIKVTATRVVCHLFSEDPPHSGGPPDHPDPVAELPVLRSAKGSIFDAVHQRTRSAADYNSR